MSRRPLTSHGLRHAMRGEATSRAVHGALALALLFAAPPVAAADEPILLELDGSFMAPVAAPQIDRFQPGASASAALLFTPSSSLLPSLRLRGGFLADGARPADDRLRDPGVGGLFTLTAGLRLRPLATVDPSDAACGTGLWLEVSAGAALTGTSLRPTFDAGIGYLFEAGDVDVGPALRFVHVLQTEDELDGSSAYLVTAGLDIVLFDRRSAPVETPVETARAEPASEGDADADADADGVPDDQDACPEVREDRDGFEDADGCPELDDDADGIPDERDACPRDAEIVNGNADEDGCPDEGLIELVGDRIVIEERVLFALNRARVRSSARPVLDAVVALWRRHPDWALVRIEGHADVQGEEAWNLELSDRRAERVAAALIELGMPASMFVSEGFGSSRPRVEGTSEAAFAANRRVELVVVERSVVPDVGPQTGGRP